MKNYEAIFIILAELGKDDQDKVITQINDIITRDGGKIDNTQNWGRRNLTFALKKKNEGIYYLVNFQIEPAKIAHLEAQYRLIENIIRSMIMQKTLVVAEKTEVK